MKVAVLVKNADKLCEALRVCFGMAQAGSLALYWVNRETCCPDPRPVLQLELLARFGGERFSNDPGNERFGFRYAGLQEITDRLRQADLVVPI